MDQAQLYDHDTAAYAVAGRDLMEQLIESFPAFQGAWNTHLADWDGESPGAFHDISQFAHFIVNALMSAGRFAEIRRVFLLMEEMFLKGNEYTRDLIAFGLLEDLQNIVGGHPEALQKIAGLLPATLAEVWREVDRQWIGHDSLATLLRARSRLTKADVITWAQFMDRL